VACEKWQPPGVVDVLTYADIKAYADVVGTANLKFD
jgi:hypothetical protein